MLNSDEFCQTVKFKFKNKFNRKNFWLSFLGKKGESSTCLKGLYFDDPHNKRGFSKRNPDTVISLRFYLILKI
ncbi:MAG: hypothetical protein CM15mP58_16670 [Burkholderiaceae bacterium]|nr:MAG: hypothetical protein CM15mP58_16670 [Burkholderiaceae bacterium]